MHEKGTGIDQGRDPRWAPGGEWDSLKDYRNDDRFVITRGVDSFGNSMPGPFGVGSPANQDMLGGDRYDSSSAESESGKEKRFGKVKKLASSVLEKLGISKAIDRHYLQKGRDAAVVARYAANEGNPFFNPARDAIITNFDGASYIGEGSKLGDEKARKIRERVNRRLGYGPKGTEDELYGKW